MGYECQGKPNGQRCPQCRVTAEILLESVASKLERVTPQLNKKTYRSYLYAIYHFTSKKKAQWGEHKSKLDNSLTKFKKEKRTLIEQRATLISKDLYDAHSQEQFEERITELSNMIQDAGHQRNQMTQGYKHQIMSFHAFLELSTNLVQYWKSADYQKKAYFSKITLLNLTLHGQKVAKVSLKKPFSDDEEGWFVMYGTQNKMQLEHLFDNLWNWLNNPKNEERAREIFEMIEFCHPAEKLKYPIQSDIAKISGTRV